MILLKAMLCSDSLTVPMLMLFLLPKKREKNGFSE